MNNEQPRKLFSIGEWLILIGLAVVVTGASLTWGKSEASSEPSAFTAVYISRHARPRSGFEMPLGKLSIGWAVTLCAVTSGALLLFDPSAREKSLFLSGQAALSLGVLALAGVNFGIYPGIFVTLLGGLLLLAGGIARYR